MTRTRKDYRLDTQPATFTGAPIKTLIVRFSDPGCDVQEFDFRPFVGRREMAAAIALGFRQYGADKTRATRGGVFTGIRKWFDFLKEHDPKRRLVRGRDIDAALVRAFIVWLGAQPWRIGTQYSSWSNLRSVLRWLMANRPDLVGADVALPYNAFPRKNALTPPRAGLPQDMLDTILAACRKDVATSWEHYCTGRDALARVDRERVAAIRKLRDLDLSDLGVLMAVVIDRCGGIVPEQKLRRQSPPGMWRVSRAIAAGGGAKHFARYLYPDSRMLIPFVIAIGAQTFANPEALLGFTRDCTSEHPLFDSRVIVSWRKGRASKEQRRSFLRDKSLSPPHLIDQVLAMTAPLVSLVRPIDRDKLFLYATVSNERYIGVLGGAVAAHQIERFVADHVLRGPDGRLIRFNLVALRTTGLARAHAALGYDLLKTQALANHASLDTTRRYVDQPLARQGQAMELSRLQGVFVNWVRGDAPEVRRSLRISRDASADIAAGRNATASGFICRDPLAGAGPEQMPGRLCTAWLGCFTCPNAVIPLDEATLSRLIATRDALVNARGGMLPERFALIYEPKLAILERDILPRFPQPMHADAAKRASSIALAPIE